LFIDFLCQPGTGSEGTAGEKRGWVGRGLRQGQDIEVQSAEITKLRYQRCREGGEWKGGSHLQPTRDFGDALWAPPARSEAEHWLKTDFSVLQASRNASHW